MKENHDDDLKVVLVAVEEIDHILKKHNLSASLAIVNNGTAYGGVFIRDGLPLYSRRKQTGEVGIGFDHNLIPSNPDHRNRKDRRGIGESLVILNAFEEVHNVMCKEYRKKNIRISDAYDINLDEIIEMTRVPKD